MLVIIHVMMVSNEAQMVQKCVMRDLCRHSPIVLACTDGMDVCVAMASIVRLTQTDVVVMGSM